MRDKFANQNISFDRRQAHPDSRSGNKMPRKIARELQTTHLLSKRVMLTRPTAK